MSGRLRGKVALITGAGQGIGRGVAVRFAREGASVGVLDVNDELAAETVQIINDDPDITGEAVGLPCDLRDPADVRSAVEHLVREFQPIDILVHNAAVMPSGVLHQTDLRDWDAAFEVNVRGAYLVCREVIPSMIDNDGGSIIFMASVTGILGLPGLAAYSATKGALIALTRAMSTDYARYNIRVNSVSPGTIDSPMLHNFLSAQSNPAPLRRQFDAMHPIGRVGTIEEVASVCLFLASDEASFVSGANYTVDGGLSVKGEQPQN
jgi:NAD(P)-dependent dehydrogenase (short-subunit alcohol dehydrogenase family)